MGKRERKREGEVPGRFKVILMGHWIELEEKVPQPLKWSLIW